MSSHATSASSTTDCRLNAPGWNATVRSALEKIIREGAGQKMPVVFDFDNTIIHGDIGEATFAQLIRSGKLDLKKIPAGQVPAFQPDGKGKITPANCASAAEYYEALLSPTVHGNNDPAPLATAYAWAVEIMAGLKLSEVVQATREVCELSDAGKVEPIVAAPGRSTFPVPVFFPEMVELLAQFLRQDFDVWIVSASNVWSVRWMVLQSLNPRLHDCGAPRGIAADRVIGVATLLADESERLYKDSVLVRECAGYAAMKSSTLQPFHLTSRLQFPVAAYSGKVACILDAIGRQPFFCAGDSPGDHAMLLASEHRLWIAREGKSQIPRDAAKLIQFTGGTNWLIQSASSVGTPHFV